MNKDTTKQAGVPELLAALLTLLAAHRVAFRQERPYRRAVALVFGELFAFARHTVTQTLLALGLSGTDWTAFYRLFSRPRFEEARLNACLFRETLVHSRPDEPYVTAIDGTQIPRASQKLPGSSWLHALRTPVFKRGIQRGQRFLHGAWLPAMVAGYTRAIPLRFLPAFPHKAQPAEAKPCKEWEAGLAFIRWVRQQLESAAEWRSSWWCWGMGALTPWGCGGGCRRV